MVRLELWQPSILDSCSGPDSMVGSNLVVGSSADFESMAGFVARYDFGSSTDSALGMLVSSDSTHSTIEECFQPSTL